VSELLPREEICELKLTLTKSQVALLTKRDPVRKAERAAAKHGPKGIVVVSRTNTVENAVESDDAAVPPPAGDQTIAAARQRCSKARSRLVEPCRADHSCEHFRAHKTLLIK
jgi:hypothetical protein